MTAVGLTSFQLLAFVILGASFVVTIVLTVRHRIAPRVGFAWGLLWISAAVAIARPELTAIVAHFLGIDRGTDVVLYFAILGMFFGFFFIYLRLRRIETDLTRIVREVAIHRATEPHATARADSSASGEGRETSAE